MTKRSGPEQHAHFLLPQMAEPGDARVDLQGNRQISRVDNIEPVQRALDKLTALDAAGDPTGIKTGLTAEIPLHKLLYFAGRHIPIQLDVGVSTITLVPIFRDCGVVA